MKKKVQLMDEVAVKRALTRLSFEIVEKSPDPSKIVLVGIKTRGLPIASRIAANIKNHSGIELPVRELDITFYRDDLSHADADPTVKKADLGLDIHGKEIIICDDVLYTGRTVRAAIEAIFSQGRPAKIGLAVLIDRGHRELPIRPDYVGKNTPTSKTEVIEVHLAAYDDDVGVYLMENNYSEGY